MKQIRLFITGADYAGKRSVAIELSKWLIANSDERKIRWHSHFVSPCANCHFVVSLDELGGCSATDEADGPEFDDADPAQISRMRPTILEQFRRHMIWRHFAPDMYRDSHHLLIDRYYADAVYAPLFYGYGKDRSFSDRRRRAHDWDVEGLRLDPETALVLVEASPDQIKARMRRSPQPASPLMASDVELVLARFTEEYESSLLPNRLRLNTSDMGPAEAGRTLVKWLAEIRFQRNETTS